jgi:scyllo-inositol 2-dehydrogenase (NADP+)
MSESVFRVGLLGWGNGGRFFHAPFIAVNPGLELAAIATSRQQVKDHYPNVKVYDSAEALFGDPSLDMIVIATPHRLHAQHAQAALAAGKHVVVEKPLAETFAEAEALVEQADRMDRLLIVYQNRRWDGDFMTVKQVIESGVLGDVYFFESHWSLYRPKPRGVWRENPDDLGGVLYDLGPHMIDHAIHLFGKPESVYAQVETHRPGNQVDDLFRLHLKFPSGVYALLVTDMMAPLPGPRFHVRGQRGTFEKQGHDPQEAALRGGIVPRGDGWGVEDPAQWGRLRTTDFSGLTYDGRVETVPGDYRAFYRAVHQALIDKQSPLDLADIVLQLRIIEAAKKSARTNTVQTFN